jgi:hypothetical protein
MSASRWQLSVTASFHGSQMVRDDLRDRLGG